MINNVECFCWIFIVLNITLFITDLEAKTFSINEALAKEAALSKTKSITTDSSELSEQVSEELNSKLKPAPKRKSYKSKYSLLDLSSERFPLLKSLRLKPLKLRKRKKASGLLIPIRKKSSPSKLKDLLQINLPLHHKKLLPRRPSRQTKKNQAYKRDIRNEIYDSRYVPLVQTIGMLLDDILAKDVVESAEYKDRHYTEETNDAVCTCTRKSKRSKPRKKTVTLPPVNIRSPHLTEDQTESASTTTNHTTHGDISSVRQNTDVSTILSGNTTSYDGDNNGLSERSSATFHRRPQGNITWDHRDHELDTRDKGNETSATHDEETTNGPTRNGSSGSRHDRGTGEFRRYTIDGRLLEAEQKNQTIKDSSEHARLALLPKFETRRDETEHPEYIRERSRKSISEDQINIGRKSLQSKEVDEKSDSSNSKRFTSYQRLIKGNGTPSKKDKELRTTNEIQPVIDVKNPFNALQAEASSDSYVVIIDGYSVAAGKNFLNKFQPN